MNGQTLAPRASRRRWRLWATPPLLLVLLWLAGFAAFVIDARRTPPPPGQADGIVVLTGGADRIAAGMALLTSGHARALLISGVPAALPTERLLRSQGVAPVDARAPVTIGRQATTTAGNALETAAWVRAQGIHSLLVVTAGYHMRRALLVLGRSLPGVTLIPVPVLSPALRTLSLGSLPMLADEFCKYLAVRLGVA